MIKKNYVANKTSTEDLTAFWPKYWTKADADALSKMIRGEDLIKKSRLNLLTPLYKILADEKARKIVNSFFSEKIRWLIENRQYSRINLINLAAMVPGELTRVTLNHISKELGKI